MDTIDTLKLLIALVRSPWMVSFIEEFYVEYLLDAGYLDSISLLVTASGRDFVALNESLLAAATA